MEFKCDNCGRKFIKDIMNYVDRTFIRCPTCGSELVTKVGYGTNKD